MNEQRKSDRIHRMRRPSDGLILHVGDELVVPLARHGFHLPMTSPDGKHGYVPLEKVAEAGRAGFKFGHQGKWTR
jgi:hypothetical protein